MATTSFRIELDFLDDLRMVAKDEGRSLSQQIRWILAGYIKKWKAGKGRR